MAANAWFTPPASGSSHGSSAMRPPSHFKAKRAIEISVAPAAAPANGRRSEWVGIVGTEVSTSRFPNVARQGGLRASAASLLRRTGKVFCTIPPESPPNKATTDAKSSHEIASPGAKNSQLIGEPNGTVVEETSPGPWLHRSYAAKPFSWVISHPLFGTSQVKEAGLKCRLVPAESCQAISQGGRWSVTVGTLLAVDVVRELGDELAERGLMSLTRKGAREGRTRPFSGSRHSRTVRERVRWAGRERRGRLKSGRRMARSLGIHHPLKDSQGKPFH
jgi:hypothetical protein